MSFLLRVNHHFRRRPSLAPLGAALLVAAGLAMPPPVLAQDVLPLRGAVDENEGGRLLGTAGNPDDAFAEDGPVARGGLTAAARRRTIGAGDAETVAPADPLATGTVPEEESLAAPQRPVLPEPRAALPEAPVERSQRTFEEDPFSAPGLRLGTFTVRPVLEQGLGWSSNPNFSPVPRSAVLSETSLRLSAVSDWATHSAEINAFGNWRRSLSGARVDEPSAGLDARLSLDLGHEWTAGATLRYDRRPESASSPVEIIGAISRPLRQVLGGSVFAEKRLGNLRLSATGSLEGQWYGDADLEGGGTLSQRDRDFLLALGRVRAGYQVSPALTPFVEAEYGRREYALRQDAAGFERSADRMALRGGLAFDLGEKFYGEVAAGWLREDFDDTRLAALSGADVTADLFWSPQRGTTLNLRAGTTVEGATTAFESGSILYSASLSLEHRLRANLTGTAGIGGSLRDYAGPGARERILYGEAGLTWWLNRYVGLTGRARYETLRSDLPGRDWNVGSVFGGIRLQR